jgi:alkylresorcinol/alkylpyrone synthase
MLHHPSKAGISLEQVAAPVDRGLGVEIVSLATALPRHELNQEVMLSRVRDVFPHLAHLEPVFANTGIERRYACKPMDWYVADHGWDDRGAVFAEEALALLEEAALKALDSAGLNAGEIDAIVTVSTTGICVPSLDAMLMNRLAFRQDTERLPIFGLGCAGGVSGLARSSHLANSRGRGHVLLLVVELCSLNFRLSDASKAMFISTALFGDGAAALVLRAPDIAQDPGRGRSTPRPRIVATGEHFWPKSENLMGWSIEPDGFGVVISTRIPAFARGNLRTAIEVFLDKHDLKLDDLDGYVMHPGGRKVLEAMESALELDKHDLAASWQTLRDFGNMSSPTVLFVLDQVLASGAKGLHLMAALGPGFTVSFALLEL